MRAISLTLMLVVVTLPMGCGTAERRAGSPVPVTQAIYTERVTGDFAGDPAVEAMIERLVASEGFDRAELVRLFSRLEHQPWIIDLMDRQAAPSRASGPTGAWTRYRARFVTQDNIDNGVRFWRQHQATLDQAFARYGVPPEYVVAILGVETRYGGYLGNTRTVEALATLAFDYPRRGEYFTRELEAFLIMARDERMDPFTPKGSYAGAMGLGQFMPTSFHGYAVDFDGDGHRDLWRPADAIGSVANYFKGHGWRRGEPVAVRARATGHAPRSLKAGYDTRYPVSQLVGRGITAVNPLLGYQDVSLLELDAAGGYEYWLGLDNFKVITSYNRSTYYAMAVHQLAQALRAAKGGGAVLSQESGAGLELALSL